MKTDHERHHGPLTEIEITADKPNSQLLNYLDRFVLASGKKPGDIKVLDFGCGRGALCVLLTRKGFHAHGVDIDAAGVNAGKKFLVENGLDESVLGTIDENGRTQFKDKYFDIILSDQVLEHVEDIDKAIAECARITTNGGWGIFSYPACFLPVEPHIFIPFVHWLPKNALQEQWIRFCLLFKKKTNWEHLKELNNKALGAYYAKYLREQTFYRTPAEMLGKFNAHGFDSEQVVITHPKIRKSKILRSILSVPFVSKGMNWVLGLFFQTDIWVVRQG